MGAKNCYFSLVSDKIYCRLILKSVRMVRELKTGMNLPEGRDRRKSVERIKDRRDRNREMQEAEEQMTELQVEQRAEAQAAEMRADQVRKDLGMTAELDNESWREMMTAFDKEVTGAEIADDITLEDYQASVAKIAEMRRDLDDAQDRAKTMKAQDSWWNRLRGGSEQTKQARAEVAARSQELRAFEDAIRSINSFAEMYQGRMAGGAEPAKGDSGGRARDRMSTRHKDNTRRSTSAGRGKMVG